MQSRDRLEPIDLPRQVGEQRGSQRGIAAGPLGGDGLTLGDRRIPSRRR